MVIISLAVALIASSFTLGLKTWSGAGKKVEAYQRVRVCLDIMSSSIRNAFISPLNKNLTFKGDRNSLSFITTSSTPQGFTRVDFGIGKEEEPLLFAELEGEKFIKPEKMFLDKSIELIEFMYYDPKDKEWKEEWDSTKLMCLPQAVKIMVTFNDEMKKMTIPEVIVMIPVAIVVSGQ